MTPIINLINLTNQGYVDIAAVGNEVMYREDLSEDELIDYINRVKSAIPNTPVGYVDAYYEFTDRPKITDVCDVILANCYPFWEGCSLEYSLVYMKQMYFQAMSAANGKKVIITETGWPSQGANLEGAFPSYENALKYFINALVEANPKLVITLPLPGCNGIEAATLSDILNSKGIAAMVSNDLVNALKICNALEQKFTIIVTGSLYLVGKALNLDNA